MSSSSFVGIAFLLTAVIALCWVYLDQKSYLQYGLILVAGQVFGLIAFLLSRRRK